MYNEFLPINFASGPMGGIHLLLCYGTVTGGTPSQNGSIYFLCLVISTVAPQGNRYLGH
jgi:hypothetical protein